jgi:alkylation response protein AidB-like acyl-CoA dehydrogenase
VRVDGARDGADLTRAIRRLAAGAPVLPVSDSSRLLTRADLDAWAALGLALTSADLVGVMRGVLDLTVAYARERRQYGVPIGSFQAVQHLLAEARCLMEGAFSVTLHPSWAVDELAPDTARSAGRVAKAYCARAARTVCETAVQVHGGMGNTWDCIVHVYLRRALLSSRWFGDDREQLRQLQRIRLGVTHELP